MNMRITPSKNDCNYLGDKQDVICVLGIGNVLWADEGFGVRCIEALQKRYEFSSNVKLIDGGTQGLYLVQHVQAATRLIIFDAVDYGLHPGALKLVENDDVPRFMGVKKMSLHQTGFQEVLMLAYLTEKYPKEVLLIGCQPEEIEDYGGSLRPIVKKTLEIALQHSVKKIQEWGGNPVLRTKPLSEFESVTFTELDLTSYELQRPTEELACRVGDDRILVKTVI